MARRNGRNPQQKVTAAQAIRDVLIASLRYGQFPFAILAGLLARYSTVPYNTLQRMVAKKGDQTSIDLSVLSRLCSTLDCTPNDLLRHVPDKNDEAIRMLLKGKDGRLKPGRPKKGGGK